MVIHMKTTLIIPDPVFRELKQRAVDRKETMSSLITEFVVRGLRERRPMPKRRFRFPTFKMGPAKVNVANREELYEFLEAERDERLYGRAQRRG